MFLRWLTERRRRHLLETPFPAEWEAILARNVAYLRLLDAGETKRLHELTQVFVAEKHWEGCGGLELTEEVRVTIGAEACVLLLGREHDLYDDVESILVYPSTVRRPHRERSVGDRSARVEEDGVALLGEAHQGGPVLLVWDDVKRSARDPEDGHNVVFHEFAHKIDMLDGGADGTPPLDSEAKLAAWAEVCGKAFLALRGRVEHGRKSFLDAYAATNEAEFFAVSTEAFFEKPREMEHALPELYELLKDFYRQDPAERARRVDGD